MDKMKPCAMSLCSLVLSIRGYRVNTRNHGQHMSIKTTYPLLLQHMIIKICISSALQKSSFLQIQELERDNDAKTAEIKRLREEKETLLKLLNDHLLVCPGIQTTL